MKNKKPREGTRAAAVYGMLDEKFGISLMSAADAYGRAGAPAVGINRSTLNVLRRWAVQKEDGLWYLRAWRVYEVGDRVRRVRYTVPGYEGDGTIDDRLTTDVGGVSWGEDTDYWPVTWDDKSWGFNGKSGAEGMYLEPLVEKKPAFATGALPPPELAHQVGMTPSQILLDGIKSKLATRAVVKRDGLRMFIEDECVRYVGPVGSMDGWTGVVWEVHPGPRYTVAWDFGGPATTERQDDLEAAIIIEDPSRTSSSEFTDATFEELTSDHDHGGVTAEAVEGAPVALDLADVSEATRDIRQAIEDHRAAIPVLEKRIAQLERELESSLRRDADVAWARAILAGETDGRKAELLRLLSQDVMIDSEVRDGSSEDFEDDFEPTVDDYLDVVGES